MSTNFRKNPQISDFIKFVQWEPSCSMRKDRQTDRQAYRQTDRHDEANSRFSKFYKTSKKENCL